MYIPAKYPSSDPTLIAGSTTDITWRDVKVGQVLQVRDNELFPADLLCLYSALPDRSGLQSLLTTWSSDQVDPILSVECLRGRLRACIHSYTS